MKLKENTIVNQAKLDTIFVYNFMVFFLIFIHINWFTL